MSDTDNIVDYEALIKNKEPIDASDPAYEQIFKDLQGGLIKSYGRKYSLYIFIQFDKKIDKEKVNKVKQWIRDEIAQNVTSTWKQLEDTKVYKITRESMRQQGRDPLRHHGGLCRNFFLSYKGYKILGFNPENEGTKINDSLFERGMKKDWEENYHLDHPPQAPDDYSYNPPESWDIGNDQIDALILLAHDGLEELKNTASTIIDKCEKIGKVIACEAGYVLRDPRVPKEIPVGPFGFADGISQPLFLKSDYDKYCESQDIKQWDPKASLKLVLKKDPFGEPYSYGSYCVFQKLETNSKRFEEKVNELAKKLKCDSERAGALVIGRFKDGTPLDLSYQPSQSDGSSSANDFNYADDHDGRKCPLHAHIRKANPRKDHEKDEVNEERRTTKRIFRAGITYFDGPTSLNKLDYLNEVSNQTLEKNIASISGLLFVCFQGSISNQFNLLQQSWADDRKFPRSSPKYLDPVIGHPATKGLQKSPPKPQEWPKKWNGEPNEISSFPFYGCVKVRGGEFFFAPSISFLKNL